MYNQMPAIGSKIEVTTRFKESYYLSNNEFRDTTYSGVVMKPPYKLEPYEFALKDNKAHNGFRVMGLRHIIDINVISGSQETIPEEKKSLTYYIAGSKGNEYTVTNESGSWTCNCAGFQFRRKCKHIEMALQ